MPTIFYPLRHAFFFHLGVKNPPWHDIQSLLSVDIDSKQLSSPHFLLILLKIPYFIIRPNYTFFLDGPHLVYSIPS